MIKKKIQYKDFDGNQAEGEWYFGLSKAELAEMALSHKGGDMIEYLQTIVKDQDGEGIITTFKKLLRASVGERSEDGKRFIKTPEITDSFMQTDAYSELFVELVTKADVAAEFINGIMPADLADKAAAMASQEHTVEDLLAMSQDEFDRVAGTDPMKMTKDQLVVAMQRRTQAA